MTTPDPRPPESRRERWMREGRDAVPHPRAALVSGAALAALLVAAVLVPVPYVVERPGPAIDVLGEWEGERVLTVEGAETYPTDGTLMMTTVSVDGGPGFTVTPAEVIVGWVDPRQRVLPREMIFPEGTTREETRLQNSVQMATSQQGSVAVALDELGIAYDRTVSVAGVEEGAPADGVLETGDAILAVDGEEVTDIPSVQDAVADREAGQDVVLTVVRDGEDRDLTVPTEASPEGAPRMGVVLAEGYDFPVDVTISVGAVGGPSAGLMFSLAVYDELTPGALTGGEPVAGTGTIAADGTVGPIGGIAQKLVGARQSGAEYFLAPSANCDEVVGRVPDGLAVVAVDTFEDARTAVTTIADTGSTASLPTCEDPS